MINYTNLNENINIYFKEIRSNSSMTREDESILFPRIANGDKAAEGEVFNKMAKLAVAVAKTYTCDPELLEDLIQEANIGVLQAIKKYDLNTGFRFSSYARWWMKATISTFLNELGIVHPCTSRLVTLANKIRDKFYTENQREISDYELLDILEERGEVVTDPSVILNIKKVRIDMPVNDDDTIVKREFGEFADRTASDNDFLDDEHQEGLCADVARLMADLSDQEKKFVKMNFGIGQDYEMTYKQIAEAEGYTQERVRQIITGALKKMKK